MFGKACFPKNVLHTLNPAVVEAEYSDKTDKIEEKSNSKQAV